MTKKEWEEQRRFISDAEALQLVKDGKYIHTFRNPGNGILIGADISRIRLLQLLEKYGDKIEISGPVSRSMGHGISITDEHGVLYIKTDEARLNAFDPMPEE